MANQKKKKGNLFTADVSMAYRVAEYMRVKVYDVCWMTRYKRECQDIQKKIDAAPEMLRGSVFEDQLPELIKGYQNELLEARKKYDKKIEDGKKFKFTQEDLDVYEVYKKGGDLQKALTKWFKAYKMDVADTQLLDDLIDAISGKRQASAKVIVQSGAMQFTDIRNKNDVIKTLYCELAEKMLAAGTLKPEWLPQDIVDFYAPKKKNKK